MTSASVSREQVLFSETRDELRHQLTSVIRVEDRYRFHQYLTSFMKEVANPRWQVRLPRLATAYQAEQAQHPHRRRFSR